MPEPAQWREWLGAIRKMRAAHPAPVDTMGCMQLASRTAPPPVARFQTLVALMLSSQTKDAVTAAAMERLHRLPLTVETILGTSEERLAELICPVGFYRKKAANIKKVAALISEREGKDIPQSLEGLLELPGVGPKMAYLVMQAAWGENVGIGVDVHVHRITNRLGWVHTKEPEETRASLQEWLPRELWTEINPLLVGFGQTICLPLRPRCRDCLLRDLCPASTAKTMAATPSIIVDDSHTAGDNDHKRKKVK